METRATEAAFEIWIDNRGGPAHSVAIGKFTFDVAAGETAAGIAVPVPECAEGAPVTMDAMHKVVGRSLAAPSNWRGSRMRITEPMTMATDYVMGAMAAVLAIRLFRAGAGTGRLPVLLWGGAFVCTAWASLLGGSYHGFLQMIPPGTAKLLWKATLCSTGIGSACILAAAAYAGTSGTLQRRLIGVVVVKLAIYLWWIAAHDEFIYVIVDYGAAMIVMLVLAWASKTGGMSAAAGWLTAGVAVVVVASLVQALRIAPHPQFNHNDLFHVVQMAALYPLYRGGLLLKG